MGWIIDFCAQALRNIVIGIGGRYDGFTMQSKFGIAVGSECMAILAVIRDLADLKERLNNITVAFDKSGKPVTTGDLEVGNAMTAFMRNTINPTMMCTAEYNPCMVHAGPFANIAVGQSSIIADRVGLKLFDYHVTESGFGADIGFEKFWNVKCRFSGLKPHVSVLTTTIRALKMHGGGPKVVTGKALDEYTKENLELVEKGCENMVHMIGHPQGRHQPGGLHQPLLHRYRRRVRRRPQGRRGRRRPLRRVQALGTGRRRRPGIRRCRHRRLQRGKRLQIPLSAGDEAARPRRTHRQGSLRRRRCFLGPEAEAKAKMLEMIPSTPTSPP
jgi:hypothetical protein